MDSWITHIYMALLLYNGKVHGYTKVGEHVDIEFEHDFRDVRAEVTIQLKFTARL